MTDSAGNSYVAGHFSGTADFDPTASYLDARDIATARGTTDAFVAKYAPDESLIWFRTMGSDAASRESAVEIAFDGAGNVIVAGSFTGNASFGALTLQGDLSIGQTFLATISTDGNFQWARNFGSMTPSIDVDSQGNFYFTQNYSLSDSNKVEISKFDSSGSKMWTKSVVPNPVKYTNTTFTSFVTVSSGGDAYLNGKFRGNVDFDPSSRTKNVSSGTGTGAYLLKLDTNGNFGWVAPFTPQSAGGFVSINAPSLDTSGNLIIGGSFYGSADLDPGSKVKLVSTPNGTGLYVTKLSSTGNQIWLKSMASNSGSDNIANFGFDLLGNIYAKGSFSGTVDFDPGIGVAYRTSAGGQDVFVIQLKSNGDFGWVETIGGAGDQSAHSMSVDGAGTVSLVGMYSAPFDVDPDPNSTSLLPNLNGATSRGFRMKFRHV